MGVYDCLILDDCGTANICSFQKMNFFFFFSVLSLGVGRGKCFIKSQAELPLLFAIRAGKVRHALWSGRDPHSTRCQPGG